MKLPLETDAELLQALAAQGEFGPGAVQRLTHWGYNRSARKVEELLAEKLIQQVAGKFQFVVLPQAN